MGELWGVYCEEFGENLLRYKSTTLYMLSIHLLAFENREVVMMSILSSLVALEYIVMPNSGAFSDDKVGSIKTLGFQWHFQNSEFNIFNTDPL